MSDYQLLKKDSCSLELICWLVPSTNHSPS